MIKAHLNNDMSIIKISGDDAREYLNNIITNNIEQVNETKSIYSCLLTPQGKFIADFYVANFDNNIILVTNKKFKDGLINGLNFYKLRSKVNIEDISNLYQYYFLPFIEETIFNIEDHSLGKTILFDKSFAFIDPRVTMLGMHVVSSDKTLGTNKLEISEDDCLSHFLKHGILSMHLIEDLSKFYPLENNLHFLNAVDFKKGCYVGQELTARMKLRNKIPRTILPFILTLKNKEDLNHSNIFESDNVVGEIIYQKDQYIFGHITFRKLSKDISLDMNFNLENHNLEINKQDWLAL
jgi:folate-binding protein YgfZ